MVRKILLGIVFISVFFQMQGQEVCPTTSRIPYEWPSHRNWFIAPNAFTGSIVNMQSGVVTAAGDAWNPVRSYESVSAASDDQGNLLFYNNGRSVWKGIGGGVTETYNGLLTGNESGIANGSASQGVITVRHPLDPDRYWILTTDDALAATSGLNAFSFDKNGNNLSGPQRLGGFRTSEGITATFHENGVDIWITVLESGTGFFSSFLLKCDGFDTTPVRSAGPTVSGNRERGGLAFSWNGEYLAQAHPNFWPDGDKIVSIYKFDNATGSIYDAKNVSGTWGSPYDVTWSPNNQRVYVSLQNGTMHYLDISSWNTATIKSTWTSTGVSTAFASMEVGPDGSMYLAHGVAGGGFMRKVNGDLNSGTSFSVSNVAGTSGQSHLGLPTMFLPPAEEPDIEEVGPYCDTDAPVDLNTTWICSGLDAEDPTRNPLAYSGPGITDQANGIFDPSVAGAGTHEIIFEYCNVNDTIWIEVNECTNCESELDDVSPEICVGETVTLDPFVVNYSAAGVWTIDSMPAGTPPVITAGADTVFDASALNTTDGVYKVIFTVTDGGETCYDSIYITVNPLPTPDLGADQEICEGDAAVTFDAGAYDSYAWQPNGETTQTIDTDVEGEYIVTVIDANGCEANDTVILTVNPLPTLDLGADQEICEGAAAVTFDAGVYDTYFWQPNGETTQTIDTDVEGEYIVTVIDANGCEANDTVILTVNPLPTPDLGADQEICEGDAAVTFDAGVYDTYLWQPNSETTQTISTDVDGEYIVTVTDANGCEANDTVLLTVNPLPTPDLGADQEICEGDAAVTFDAGAYDSYAWQPNGETTQTIDTDVYGEYIVTVTDANGCEANDTVLLTVNPLPTPDLGADVAICNGGLGISFTPGNFASYSWSDGSSTDLITTNIAGQYFVDVIDTLGCENSDTVNLVVNPLPNIDLGSDLTICSGGSVTLDAGPNFQNYIWSDGSMNQTVLVDENNAGEFNVLVIDTNGCSTRDTIEIIVAPSLSVDLGPDTAFCNGNELVIKPVVPNNVTYSWGLSGSTIDSIIVSTTGVYSLEIEDATGCKGTDTINVVVHDNPILDLGADVDLCPTFDTVFDAGNTWSSVSWSTGAITNSITANTAGVYFADVIDGNGCVASDTVALNYFDTAVVDLGSDITICPGTSATFDAGAFASYAWQDGSLNQTYIGTIAEKVYVDAVDVNGCTAVDSAEIFMANSLPIDLGVDTAICDGETITLDAGYPATGYTFLWNTGASTPTIDVTTSGIYGVEVQDVTGCSGSDSIEVTVNLNPTVDLGPDLKVCPGFDSSFVVGNEWAAVSWSTSELTNQIQVTNAGNYYVDVVDTNGCLATDTANFDFYPAADVDLGNDQTVCPGSTALFSAGSFASYLWQDGSGAATYSSSNEEQVYVSVVDNNGCRDSDTADIFVRNALVVDLGSDRDTCDGNSITLKSGYPNSINTFIWSTNETTQDISVATSGTYWVDVTDANGCVGTDTVLVTINPNPTLDLGPDLAICDGEDTIVDVGNNWSTILWDDASVNPIRTIDATGTYSVVVTDNNGCTTTDEIDLTVNANPTVDLGSDQEVCPGNSVTFSTTPANFADYTWQNGSKNATYSTLNPEVIWVDVLDANGCFATDTVELTNLPALNVELPNDTSFCDGNSYEITVPGFNPANHTYLWSTSEVTPSITVNQSGTYNVFVSNGGGCAGYDSIVITVNSNPVPSVNDTGVCEGENAIMYTETYADYLWSDGSTTQQITPTLPGTYSVTVTDANGCVGSGSADYTVYAKPLVSDFPNQTACEGETITLSPELPIGDYYWKPTGQTTKSIDVTTNGEYEVVVTNANGCKDSTIIKASFNTIPVIDLGEDIVICEGQTALITYYSGAGSISWSNGQVGDSIIVDTTGNFIATFTDANGCENQDEINVKLSLNPRPVASNDTVVCMDEIGELLISVNTSTRNSVLWGTGEREREILVDREGTYLVQAMNEDGCIGKDTVIVSRRCVGSLFVPTGFTPNGDGINDYFGPKGLNVTDFDFYVFNRWGEQIFHSTNIDEMWDGMFLGREAQIDVYVWKVYYRTEEDYGGDKMHQKVGKVTLVR